MHHRSNQSRVIFFFPFLLLSLIFPGVHLADQSHIYPGKLWEAYRSPETAGWSSTKLKDAREYYKAIGSAAALFIHDGKIVLSWGDVRYKFRTHSIRKSFLNTLYGIHVEEGRIDLDKTMSDLGIDDIHPLSEEEKKARVIDLLKCRSGVYHAAAYETSSMKHRRPARGSHAPGSYWYYNNWDFNTLVTIFEQETGTKFFEEFDKRIATPLQMQHFQVTDGFYDFQDHPSIHPASAIRMSALDMARFGLLYLHKGYWKGEQIVPKEWIEKEIHSYSTGRRGYGVGFKWETVAYGALRDVGAYYTRGYRGHWIFILPKVDSVFVHRFNTEIPHGRVFQRQVEILLEGILAANPDSGIPRPDMIDPFRNAKRISVNLDKIEPAPFPENSIYTPPATNVSPKLRALLGQWEGNWGKVLHSFLIVDKVDVENASLTFGWGTYSPWEINKGSSHHRTRITNSNGRPTFRFHGNDGTFIFYLNKDLETMEGYFKSTYIQMRKTASPTFTTTSGNVLP